MNLSWRLRAQHVQDQKHLRYTMIKDDIHWSVLFQVLYMWSLDGDSLLFPSDVSLSVGGDSGIQHLVLQVHYISNDMIPEHGDNSGVLVQYQTQPTGYSAGIVSLHVHGVVPGDNNNQ